MENSPENFDKLRLDFISTVSHELRTPLTSIRGFAETLISSRDKLSDEQQIKFLNIIKEQSNRLINLVENLLSASAQADAEEIYVFKPVVIRCAVEKTISILQQKYARKEFDLNIPKSVPEVLVDEEKFEQILLNIIENACKYSFENTNVSVNATVVQENVVCLDIINEGETIAAKDYSRIFEKFVRLDNPMTGKAQGSGMGLYLAKKMTNKMGGDISVQSENGQTVFSLSFPVATAENIAKARIAQSLEVQDD